jgi:hypothetical protein
VEVGEGDAFGAAGERVVRVTPTEHQETH